MTSRSLWVMRITVTPRPRSFAQDVEQLVGLLRGEHGARLVEDENAGAAIKHLHDLDALLPADWKGADQRTRIKAQTVFTAEPFDLAARRVETLPQQRAGFGSEDDVLQHRERIDQHEMLVHHADAGFERIARIADLDRLAVDANLAAIGLVQAHQR
jgi:hypothetical protein